MHETSYRLMDEELGLCPFHPANVLDVGSFDVNGTYRPLVEQRGWQYTGLDVRPGPNVDVVAQNPYRYPFGDGAFDVVICGNALHNIERPWLAMAEMVRVVKAGGMLVVIAPTAGKPASGRFPGDYFRFMPDGMQALFDLTESLEHYGIRVAGEFDVVARAWKKEGLEDVREVSPLEMVLRGLLTPSPIETLTGIADDMGDDHPFSAALLRKHIQQLQVLEQMLINQTRAGK